MIFIRSEFSRKKNKKKIQYMNKKQVIKFEVQNQNKYTHNLFIIYSMIFH